MRNFLRKIFISDETKLNNYPGTTSSKDAKTGLGLVREYVVQILERVVETQVGGQSSCTLPSVHVMYMYVCSPGSTVHVHTCMYQYQCTRVSRNVCKFIILFVACGSGTFLDLF